MPRHTDNKPVTTEPISLTKNTAGVRQEETPLIDHASTRPWTATRAYKRTRNPVWTEYNCAESNEHVFIGNEGYLMSADGYLMPTRKGQPPPDPRYFGSAK